MAERPFAGRALSPTSLVERGAAVFGDRTAFIGVGGRTTYASLAERSARLAGAVGVLGARPGDRVSLLAPNTALALESHLGVPWSGAVLNMLNTRLSVGELATIVDHAGSTLLLVDRSLSDLGAAVGRAAGTGVRVVVEDELDAAIDVAEPVRRAPEDEWELLAINYTSGTTGRPKGVMYAHRGAYLQALAMAVHLGLGPDTVFLWTLPMFHCNGWCFPWAVTAAGGVHVELPVVDPELIWAAIREHGVTHLNAAPTVLQSMVDAAGAAPVECGLRVATGGAPPSPALLARLSELGVEVTHLYGLTESYGPAVLCVPRSEWRSLDDPARVRLLARQGVANVVSEPVRVVDDDGIDVPADGSTIGEVVLRGDNVMLGYYRDPEATAAASSRDGWFRTGDLGVLHPTGELELRDRAKDIIISGGENITSIEVEHALASHEAVRECGVVAAPDPKWGEVPVAFVTLVPGSSVSAVELIEHVRSRLARFKAPNRIVFGELPKTATGKIQKHVLREQARGDGGSAGI